MKNLVFAFWILIGFVSCENKPIQLEKVENETIESQEVEKEETEYVFRPYEYYSKFKFHNLKEFKIDTSISSSINTFVKVDSNEWNSIFQGSKNYNHEFNPCYYYSNFSDTTQIAILESSDEASSTIISLLRFDKTGKLIGNENLAIEGGDGGKNWSAYGKFINQKYIRTNLFEKYGENENERLRDSLIVKLSFLQDRDTKSDTLFHKFRIIKY